MSEDEFYCYREHEFFSVTELTEDEDGNPVHNRQPLHYPPTGQRVPSEKRERIPTLPGLARQIELAGMLLPPHIGGEHTTPGEV